MNENNKNEQGHERGFFDQLMFGPPRQMDHTQQQPHDVAADKTDQKEETMNSAPPNKEETANQEVDMVQMMQQIDTLMNYANKFGPQLKKLAPLFDLLKQFGGPKK